jgi:hypothetical protein
VAQRGFVTLEEFAQQIPDFNRWSFAQKIRAFAWYVQTQGGKAHFQPADVSECFNKLGLERPSAVGPFFTNMMRSKPKQLLKSSKGYALERRVKEEFDAAYGQREATIVVDKMLSDLPGKIPGIEERAFLDETLTCFRHKAFRAAIVMAWNLAYDHFMRWILSNPKRLNDFNTQLPLSYRKADVKEIKTVDDFTLLLESQVLNIAFKANVLSKNCFKLMNEKLTRRNIAAHPSDVLISQLTAEEFIKDLVENIVLKLK